MIGASPTHRTHPRCSAPPPSPLLGLRVAYGAGADRRPRAPRTPLARARRRHAAHAGPAARPRRARDRRPRRRDRRRAAGAPLRPFLAASAAGDLADIAATVAGAPRAARRRRPRDARRRRRLGAADRRPRRRRRPLTPWRSPFDRTGTGRVLVLLHPLGADRHVWAPVMEPLAAARDVIAFDLPGFGESAPLNGSGPPRPPRSPSRRGEPALPRRPHHVAGQLARRLGRARARRGRPRALGHRDRPRRAVARAAGAEARDRARRWPGRSAPLLPALVRSPAGRRLALAGTVAHAERVPPDAALRLVRAYADAPGFEAVNRAMRAGRFTGSSTSASRSRWRGPSTTGSSRRRRTCRRPSAACRWRARATCRCGTRPRPSAICCCRAAGASCRRRRASCRPGSRRR